MKPAPIQVCIREHGHKYVVTLCSGPFDRPGSKCKEIPVSDAMFYGSAEAFAESLRAFLSTGGATVASGIAHLDKES